MPAPQRLAITSAVRRALEDHLRAQAPLTEALSAARREADAATLRLDRLEARLATVAEARNLAALPWSGSLTVDQAWRRHPGAPAVFAARHLPACDGCSVRFDETVEEACLAYGIDLASLLDELKALPA